jgi:hypothetical protein
MNKKYLVLMSIIFMFSFCLAEVLLSVSSNQAFSEIQAAQGIIDEMQDSGMPTLYMRDTLIHAKRVFEQAKYVEILKNPLASAQDKDMANNVLRLIDWKNISYDSVLIYTEEIKQRKVETLYLYDLILVVGKEIEDFDVKLNLTDEKRLFESANFAFFEDRQKDADNFLIEIQNSIERKKEELVISRVVRRAIVNIFLDYWKYFLGGFILLFIVGIAIYKRTALKRLKKRIKSLEAEKISLNELIKDIQTKRFNTKEMSGIVYNIRLKKYETRTNEINEILPVLKSQLKRYRKN